MSPCLQSRPRKRPQRSVHTVVLARGPRSKAAVPRSRNFLLRHSFAALAVRALTLRLIPGRRGAAVEAGGGGKIPLYFVAPQQTPAGNSAKSRFCAGAAFRTNCAVKKDFPVGTRNEMSKKALARRQNKRFTCGLRAKKTFFNRCPSAKKERQIPGRYYMSGT